MCNINNTTCVIKTTQHVLYKQQNMCNTKKHNMCNINNKYIM